MTLCSSQAQQAGFGPRPSFQDTTRFVNKIRDADRWTQKERARAGTSPLFTQTAGEITNVFFHTASFLPPAYQAFPPPRPSPVFPPHFILHFLLVLLLPPLYLCSMHHLSLLVQRSFSLHVPHFYDSLVSLRQIKPKNILSSRCCLSYNCAMAETKKTLKVANSFDTFQWLEFQRYAGCHMFA